MAEISQLYTPPAERKDNTSPLLKARREAKAGEKKSFCPFGCGIEELDDNWYCRHLIGFTLPGEKPQAGAKFAAMHIDPVRGTRIVAPRIEVTRTKKKDGLGNPGEARRKTVDEIAQTGDQFVQISSCYRVYRDVDKVAPPELPDHLREAGETTEEATKNKK